MAFETNSELYPLTLEPIIADQFWGRASTSFSEETNEFTQGTMWMATEISRVATGPMAGRSVGALKQVWGPRLVGSFLGTTTDVPLPVELKLKRTGNLAVAIILDEDSLWYILAADENATLNVGFYENLNLREALLEAQSDPGVWSEFLMEYPAEAGQCLFLPKNVPLLLGSGLTVAQISAPARTLPHWPLPSNDEEGLRLALQCPKPHWLAAKPLGAGQGEIFTNSRLSVKIIAASHLSSRVAAEGVTFLWPLFGQGRIRASGPAPATRLTPGRILMLPSALGRYAIESSGTVGFLLVEAF